MHFVFDFTVEKLAKIKRQGIMRNLQ